MPAQQAKYTVVIPTRDNQGNPLGNISTAAHEWLYRATGHKGTYITGPHKGNWGDDPQEEFEHLVAVADDHPEMDSHMKQLAMEVARGANQWGVFVMKEGKGGVQSWVVDNPQYKEGEHSEIGSMLRHTHTLSSRYGPAYVWP